MLWAEYILECLGPFSPYQSSRYKTHYQSYPERKILNNILECNDDFYFVFALTRILSPKSNNQSTPATTFGTQHHNYKSPQRCHVYAPIRPQQSHWDTTNETTPFVLYDADRAASNEVYQAVDRFHVNAMSFQLDNSAGLAC